MEWNVIWKECYMNGMCYNRQGIILGLEETFKTVSGIHGSGWKGISKSPETMLNYMYVYTYLGIQFLGVSIAFLSDSY